MVALIKEEMEAMGQGIVSRIYRTPNLGQFDQVVHEMEFQDIAEREKFWAEWREKRATPEFWKRFDTLRRPGGSAEIWTLEA
jgi:hypothetical protein